MEENEDESEAPLLGGALSDEQKRALRRLRLGYRAQKAEVKDNGWELVVTYMDGSTVSVSSKLLKLKADALKEDKKA